MTNDPLAVPCAVAQQFDFPSAAIDDPAALPKFMPGLAKKVIAVYREDDRTTYLDNLLRMQSVARRYDDAEETLAILRKLTANSVSPQAAATQRIFEIFASSGVRQIAEGTAFDEALRRSFRESVEHMDDQTAERVLRALMVDQSFLQQDVNDRLQQQKVKSTISTADARGLIRAYQVEETFRSLGPLAPDLAATDDLRRYIVDTDVCVPLVVRV